MATVKTEKMWLLNSNFILKINCDVHGQFSAKLPDFVAAHTGEKEVYGDSLQQCRKAFLSFVEDYKEAKRSKSQVLIYEFEHENDNESMRISVSVGAFVQTTLSGQGKKLYTYKQIDNVEAGLPEDMPNIRSWRREQYQENQIPLTSENVKFFSDLYYSFVRLQQKIASMSSNPDRLLAAIVSQSTLLPAPK